MRIQTSLLARIKYLTNTEHIEGHHFGDTVSRQHMTQRLKSFLKTKTATAYWSGAKKIV
jgi:hypothetical protein